MGAITGAKVKLTEFSGDYKILIITATIASASDTITLTEATHGISEITGVISIITGGLGANLKSLQITYSGLVITVVSKKAAGTDTTAWSGTTIELWVVGK